ncbi:MAG: methyltransferase domain-containing protein [Pseudomonadota bacterium]
MDHLKLLLDLHGRADRQGPGSDEDTKLALRLSGLKAHKNLTIADIGCGTGASTLVLAEELDASIKAVDLFPEFLERLTVRAETKGVRSRIQTIATSMEDLPFEPESLDAVWSEGAIYNIGFETGVKAWRSFLKPGGVLAVSELTWLTATRPQELNDHWASEYPHVATASEKIAQIEGVGYTLLGYFPLAPSSWLDTYYRPLQARFDVFLTKHKNARDAQSIVAGERREIGLYERFSSYVSYGFYIAQKLPDRA